MPRPTPLNLFADVSPLLCSRHATLLCADAFSPCRGTRWQQRHGYEHNQHGVESAHTARAAMTQNTASEVFTVEELWLLQSVIRHEVPQLDQWDFPPASLDLNDQI